MADIPITKELLQRIAKMPRQKRKAYMRLLGEQEWRRCAADPMYWLDASQHTIPYVFTFDPHQMYTCNLCKATTAHNFNVLEDHLKIYHEIEEKSPQVIQASFKELPTTRPFTLLPYMPPILERLQKDQLVAIEKSRDMMATWLVVAFYAWDAYFHAGREIIFQSETGMKAAELVDRACFIAEHQPRFLQRNAINSSVGPNRSGVLLFGGGKTKGGSEILGFPQGPDQVRMFHPSAIFLDEAAFQVDAAAAFAAVKPAIQNGGKATLLSSANPSFFMHICRDTLDRVM